MTTHPSPELLDRRAELPAGQRRALLEHVARCGRCRRIYAAGDPARLFALLGARPPAPGLLDEVSAGVLARLDEASPGRRWGATSWNLKAAGAWAAAILLAVGLFFVRQAPPDAPAVATLVEAPGSEVRPPQAGVTLLSSPGEAQLVDMTVGEFQVVMIFDPSLDL